MVPIVVFLAEELPMWIGAFAASRLCRASAKETAGNEPKLINARFFVSGR